MSTLLRSKCMLHVSILILYVIVLCSVLVQVELTLLVGCMVLTLSRPM